MASPLFTVIGGINMDIGGAPAAALRERDSNPGAVSLRPGGVGRNIAHDLRLMGQRVRLIAALGDDVFGRALLEGCEALGLDMSLCLLRPRERSSCYLYINDERGDMRLAVADMDICERVTPEALDARRGAILDSDAVIADANLSIAALDWLGTHCTAPLIADAVSAAKATRLKALLPRLCLLKPNRLEAEALTGESDPRLAASALLHAGVERVFISLGGEGMLAAEGETRLWLPAEKIRVRSTTGAGDAATAALAVARLKGLGLRESAELAIRAGALTCESPEANSPRLSELFQEEGT